MCLLQTNKKYCLHCGEGQADYCEKCYQELTGQNAILQLEKDLKEQRAKALMLVIEKYRKKIVDLEYIRDCYYKEIQERKMFKLDINKNVSEQEKIWVVNNEILKRANKVYLYEKETYCLENNNEMPILVYINENEYKALKTLSETYENIKYDTEKGIYIE